MKRIIVLVTVLGFVMNMSLLSPVFAADPLPGAPAAVIDCTDPTSGCSKKEAACNGSGGSWSAHGSETGTCSSSDSRTVNSTLRQVMNILFYVSGSIAILMIIIGGVRYVVSAGDQSAVTGAKNTVMYSMIGLVVIVISAALVSFVLNNLGL
jgi:hypothetical protein